MGTAFFSGNERVACLFQTDASFIIEDWFCCIHIHGKGCSGKNDVKLYHDIKICADRVGLFCSLLAQGGKDHFNLFLFFQFQLADVIISFTIAIGSINKVEPVED